MSLALGDSLVHGPRAFVGASSLGVWTKAAPCCVLGLQSVGVPWAHTCQQVLGTAAQVCWDGVWAAAAYGSRQPDGSRAPCLGALAFPRGVRTACSGASEQPGPAGQVCGHRPLSPGPSF